MAATNDVILNVQGSNFDSWRNMIFENALKYGDAGDSVATGTEGPMYFTLAFTLANLRGRMYDWSHLTNYLFICALAFQTNTLYLMLWDSAFNGGFSSTTTITSNYLLINI